MKDTVAVGLDLGTTWTKVCVSWPGFRDGLVAKIPSRYARKCPPGQLNASGQRRDPQAFPLIFTRNDKSGGDFQLWFGQDILAISGTQKMDVLKYDAAHIQVLFKGALWQWQQTHRSRNVDLSQLGKLDIVASMPPGLFEDAKIYGMAKRAYHDAFSKNAQSHIQIRDGKHTKQIVTHFVGLQQEAVAWGQDVPRSGEWILVFDLGGGTNDWAAFNGSSKPRAAGTSNTGLIHIFEQINPVSPQSAELQVLRSKKIVVPEISEYYSDMLERIQRVMRQLPPISHIYVIGGGAALMPISVQRIIKLLAPKVTIGDEYANARASWLAARGK